MNEGLYIFVGLGESETRNLPAGGREQDLFALQAREFAARHPKYVDDIDEFRARKVSVPQADAETMTFQSV